MLKRIGALLGLFVLGSTLPAGAADEAAKEASLAAKPVTPAATQFGAPSAEPSRLYVLKPNDVVDLRVFQEEDLTTKVRVARDGSVILNLVGTVNIGGKTVEQATGLIRDLLAKDYLVNPQVTLTIFEYAKRRVTVLGQVNRPGAYEMPSDDRIDLLQAIAMAGGYTRIGNPKKVMVQRMVDGETKIFGPLDAKAMAEKKDSKSFEILPDDTITVREKWL